MWRSGTATVTLTWPNGDFSLQLYVTGGECANTTSLVTGGCTILGTTRPGTRPGVITRPVGARRRGHRLGAEHGRVGANVHRRRGNQVVGRRTTVERRAGHVQTVDRSGRARSLRLRSEDSRRTHMNIRNRPPSATGMRRRPFLLVVAACLLLPRIAGAQGLTGALIGTVKDAAGRRPFGCGRPNQLAGADWRAVDDEDRRKGAVAIPERASGILRARNRPAGISPVSRRRHLHRRRGHHRENACPDAGSAWRTRLSCTDPARASTPETPASAPGSAPRTSTRSR